MQISLYFNNLIDDNGIPVCGDIYMSWLSGLYVVIDKQTGANENRALNSAACRYLS